MLWDDGTLWVRFHIRGRYGLQCASTFYLGNVLDNVFVSFLQSS